MDTLTTLNSLFKGKDLFSNVDLRNMATAIDCNVGQFAKTNSRKVGLYADDVKNDICLKIFMKASTFDRERGKPGTWAGTIARNACVDFFYKNAQDDSINVEEGQEDVHLIEQQHVKKHQKEYEVWEKVVSSILTSCNVREAIAGIPNKSDYMIVNMELDGYSRKEIAQELGLSVNNVNVRYHRAMKDTLPKVLRSVL